MPGSSQILADAAARGRMFEAVARDRVTQYAGGSWYCGGLPVTDESDIAALELLHLRDFDLWRGTGGWAAAVLTPAARQAYQRRIRDDSLRTATGTLTDLGPRAVEDAVRHAVERKEGIVTELLEKIRLGPREPGVPEYFLAPTYTKGTSYHLAVRYPGAPSAVRAGKTVGLMTLAGPYRAPCVVRVTYYWVDGTFEVGIFAGDRLMWLLASGFTDRDAAEELAGLYAQREGLGVSRIDVSL